MPYQIRPDHAVLVVTPDGECGLDDSLEMLRQVADHARLTGAAGVVLDVRGIGYTPNFGDVDTLARVAAEIEPRFALVVAGDLHGGVAHQFASLANLRGAKVRVFEDPVAAAAWLGAVAG
jgi:hypothetical protein